MQLCERAAGDGPGQLLLPFGQFTFRVKGAKSPLRVQSSRFLNFFKFKNLDGSGAKSLFRHADAPIPNGTGAFLYGNDFVGADVMIAPKPSPPGKAFSAAAGMSRHERSAAEKRGP